VGDKVTVRLPLQGLSILRFGAYRSYFTVLLPERCGGDQYLRYHTRLDLIRCLGVGLDAIGSADRTCEGQAFLNASQSGFVTNHVTKGFRVCSKYL
jgi:hypothetical protein